MYMRHQVRFKEKKESTLHIFLMDNKRANYFIASKNQIS